MKLTPVISILDYGSGNLRSVLNVLEYLGYKVHITKNLDLIDSSTHLILPGVGSYKNCVEKIKKNLSFKLIKNQIIDKQKPLLGICVGMQVLSSSGYENGEHNGLNIIKGKVVKLENTLLPVPQVGWNEIEIKKQDPILDGIPNKSEFYFLHSYQFKSKSEKNILSSTNYENNFTSIINEKKIYGVQFHPEKSQTYGLRLLKNFVENIK